MSPSLQRLGAYACLAASMALVGVYVALSKPLAAVIPVFLLAWLRFGIGAVAMLGWLSKPADEAPLSTHTRGLLFLESFLGNFLFSLCMLYGVSLTSAVSAGVIMASIPAVVALMSRVFLGEPINRRTLVAIGCAGAGIALLAWTRPPAVQSSGDAAGAYVSLLGNALVFAAVLCEAAYAVIGKSLSGRLGAKRISALINLWGLALITPLGLWAALGFDFGGVSIGSWVLLVFYGLAASVWTVWLWMTGLRHVSASRAGVFTVMLPIAATLTGVIALNEPVSSLQLAALALGLAGIVLATGGRRTD